MTLGASLEVSDDVLREQVYLVARGVRPLALAGECDVAETFAVRSRLAVVAAREALAFVRDLGKGRAACGFASHAWAIDLFVWASTEAPALQRDRILGLLLGYSPDAVRRFEELGAALEGERRNEWNHSTPESTARSAGTPQAGCLSTTQRESASLNPPSTCTARANAVSSGQRPPTPNLGEIEQSSSPTRSGRFLRWFFCADIVHGSPPPTESPPNHTDPHRPHRAPRPPHAPQGSATHSRVS